jgi:hypothetical protein
MTPKFKLLSILFTLQFANLIQAQSPCNIFSIEATNYQVVNCKGLVFQSFIGPLGGQYSDCGKLNFSPIITPPNITTTIGDINYSEELVIYPNPVLNSLKIKSSQSEKIDKIEVKNLLGQILETYQDILLDEQVNVESLNAGTYLMLIYIKEDIKIKKFIKIN